MKIHIVTNIDNGKGLERDYRILARILERWGHAVRGIHYQRPTAPEPCDLALFLEVYEPRLAEGARRRWLIPNAEWWRGDVAALADFDLVLCKTRDAAERLRPLGARVQHLGFTSEDRLDRGVPRARRFLHVPGGSIAKGTDAVLLAWERYRIPYPLTVVSSLGFHRRSRLVDLTGRLDDRSLRFHQNASRFHLCPSRYEGWGHSLHEGLSVGAAVVVPETPDMRGVDGAAIRVPAEPAERLGLAETHAVSAETIRDAVERCAAFTEAELRRIEMAAREAFEAEREELIANLWQVLEGPSITRLATSPVTAPVGPALTIAVVGGAPSAPATQRTLAAAEAQASARKGGEVAVLVHPAPDAPLAVAASSALWIVPAGALLEPDAIARVMAALEAGGGERDAIFSPPFPRAGLDAARTRLRADMAPLVPRAVSNALGHRDAAVSTRLAEIGSLYRAGLVDWRTLPPALVRGPERGVHGAVADPSPLDLAAEGARAWRERLESAAAALHPGGVAPARVLERRLVRAARTFAVPALRSLFGGVVVVGRGADRIADDVERLAGLATRVATVDELASLPRSYACGAIASDVGARDIADQLRRVVKGAGPIVIANPASDAEVDVSVEYA